MKVYFFVEFFYWFSYQFLWIGKVTLPIVDGYLLHVRVHIYSLRFWHSKASQFDISFFFSLNEFFNLVLIADTSTTVTLSDVLTN